MLTWWIIQYHLFLLELILSKGMNLEVIMYIIDLNNIIDLECAHKQPILFFRSYMSDCCY